MKKFAIAAATATALTLTMANVAMAQTSAQAPMTVAANEVAKTKEATSDTWITTKVKSDLLTEKGIPGSDIKVETNKGVVSLSSTTAHDVLPKFGWSCRYHNLFCHWYRNDRGFRDSFRINRADEESTIHRLCDLAADGNDPRRE